ncbi:MAG: macro domain-containing protein [Proteobacteria bacterium]|nr:macro domain-containing protein [Pseudomonadota bacterium]
MEYKSRFPAMFNDYKERCSSGRLQIGEPYLWEDNSVQILNFPTKRHWRDKSRLDDIEAGLKYLANNYQKMGLYTLALAPLGCGNGGLNWKDVLPLMEHHLGDIPDLEVFAYRPRATGAIVKGDSDHNDHGDYPLVKDKLAISSSL